MSEAANRRLLRRILTLKQRQESNSQQYSTLVMRVYFRDRAERDRLAQELNAEEVPTTGGYLTVIGDRDLYYNLTARGLRVPEIDEKNSRDLSDPQVMRDTFYGGYKTVEEIYAFLDQKVAQFPNLVEKIDIGDSWCKMNPGSCVLPSPWNGYDLFVLHITNRNIPGPKPVFWADGDIHAREIATPEVVMRMIDYLLNNYDTDAFAGLWTITTSGLCPKSTPTATTSSRREVAATPYCSTATTSEAAGAPGLPHHLTTSA